MENIINCVIVGDSFSTDDSPDSWCNQLPFTITNLSSRGISEYRIYQTIKNLDFSNLDLIIVCHTSSLRIYASNNPYYLNHPTHPNCDLLYNDMKSRLPDEFAKNVTWWFENVFDLELADLTHNLMVEKIKSMIPVPALHISFFKDTADHILDLSEIWKMHPGKINHLDNDGNQLVTKTIIKHVYKK